MGVHRLADDVGDPFLLRFAAGIGRLGSDHLEDLSALGIPRKSGDQPATHRFKYREHLIVIEQIFHLAVQIDILHRSRTHRRRCRRPGFNPFIHCGHTYLRLRPLGKVRQQLITGIRINICPGTELAQIVVALIVKRGDKHPRMRGGAGQTPKCAVRLQHTGDRIPGLIRNSRHPDFTEGGRERDPATNVKYFIPQAFFTSGLTVIPVGITFLGGMIDKVFGGERQTQSRPPVDDTPTVPHPVRRLGKIHFIVGNLIQTYQLYPRPVG